MKNIVACLAFVLLACGSKSKPAPASNTGTTTSGSAATCCCAPQDKTAGKYQMMAPTDCTAAAGTCEADEAECHGITGPIP